MSRTEQALQALLASLVTQSQLPASALPTPLRNEALPTRMFQTGADLEIFFNVWDGDGDVTDETLGAEDPAQEDGYNIEHHAIIEWVVAGGDKAAREARFDAGLIAIHDAVKPVAGVYLGDVVDSAAIDKVTRAGRGLVTDGLPNIKSAEISVALTFTSSRPF